MKRVLITGANSYVGISLDNYLRKWPDKYEINTVDLEDEAWRKMNFSAFDVVFHVAGIAHIKETKNNQALYFRVNRDLAYETAEKAEAEGVNQFIYLSSMSVYGIESGVITKDSPLSPKTAYGKSKLEAEELLTTLENIQVAIVRPPLIYGKGCKGNYQKLAAFAKKFPIFPNYENHRSMLYIDNLCEFIRLIIENKDHGLFFPQNKSYVNISEMVAFIAAASDREIYLTKVFNPFIKVLTGIRIFLKVFGSLVYEKSMSEYEHGDYQIIGFKESVIRSEKQ